MQCKWLNDDNEEIGRKKGCYAKLLDDSDIKMEDI